MSGDSTDLLVKDVHSNVRILAVTAGLFFAFVVAEIIGALAAHSLSLLGDAAAMSVDVFTYFTNMYAERYKIRGLEMDKSTRLMLEVYVPSFSVIALLSVTVYAFTESIKIIISKPTGEDDVKISFLYGFASANMLVDIVSGYMFLQKGKAAFISEIKVEHRFLNRDFNREAKHVSRQNELTVTNSTNYFEGGDAEEVVAKSKNLNMVSACTHLGADTLRTVSVFIAAIVNTTTGTRGDLCDAWACIVVTATIVMMVYPLVREIFKAYSIISQLQ